MSKSIWGYARVSTDTQNLDRQIKILHEFGIDDRHIVTDKASGKNFNRTGYNMLIGTNTSAAAMREGDLLVICSLDRLGRNYEAIKEQWEFITRVIKADIKVLDMPLLDTSLTNSNGNTLDKKFIADLVLQILSYTAQKEREFNHRRQQQGYDAMPVINGRKTSAKTGRVIGRPKIDYPDKWLQVYQQWKNKSITAVKAMHDLALTKSIFYKLVKKYENEIRGDTQCS